MDTEELKTFNPDVVLDIKRTLISNSVYFMFGGLYTVFLVKVFIVIERLQNEDIKILALIVFIFAFIRITSGWQNYNLEYKIKE